MSWKAEALAIHDYRWGYLKSDMHVVGHLLDPQNIDCPIEPKSQDTFIALTERLCLRNEMHRVLHEEGDEDTARALTMDSPAVCESERVSVVMQDYASYWQREGVLSRAFVWAHARKLPPWQCVYLG